MTISYELAKELKEAGFVQPERYEAYNPETGLWEYNAQLKGVLPYTPTLSELIEAVGLEFAIQSDKGMWIAQRFGEGGERITANGSTPEIAVASLWLELKLKNNK